MVAAWVGLVGILIDYLTGWHIGPVESVTNPVTFLALLCATTAIFLQNIHKPVTEVSKWLWVVALALGASFPLSKDIGIMLFGRDVGATGWNTALCIWCLGLSQLLTGLRRNSGLGIAAAALLFPFVTINGYLLGVQDFWGEMAVLTASVLLALGTANLISFVRHPLVALVLNGQVTGQMMRLQIKVLLGTIVLVPIILAIPVNLKMFPAMANGVEVGAIILILETVELILLVTLVFYVGARFSRVIEGSLRAQQALLGDLSEDPLTGAATRKSAVDCYYQLSGRQKIALILLDIDHFKQVNDGFGHVAGDQALCGVVRVLQDEVKSTALVSRWGGEEFLVMAWIKSDRHAAELAEQLRLAVQKVPIFPGSPKGLTASFGVMVVDAGDRTDLHKCIENVDQALYQAKRQGRNRVVFYGQKEGAGNNFAKKDVAA